MRRKRKRCDDGEESLQGAEGAQAELGLTLELHPVEAEAVALRRCTAGLLFERDRGAYDGIVQALAEDRPIRRIKRDFRVGTETVLAVRRREAQNVGTLKARIADRLLEAAQLGSERLVEVMEDCDDPVQVAMATKMAAETGNLLRGQATQLVGHVHVHVDAQAAEERLRELGRKMGCGGGENLGWGGAGGVVGVRGDGDGLSAVSNVYVVDCERVNNERHTDCHTVAGVTRADGDADEGRNDGGGGDAEAGRAVGL